MESVTRMSLTGSLLVVLAGAVQADVITDWNEKAVAAGAKERQAPFMQTRSLAIVHLAMFDVANAFERRWKPYRVQRSPAPGASRDVAVAAAAHFALIRLYPDQATDLDTSYRAALAAVPDGEPKSQGIQFGEQVAAEMLALRARDGADAPNTYRPFTTAGRYVPTVFPVASNWGQVTPFALEEGRQFRPAAPYPLNSPQWATDYNELKRLGSKTGSERSAEQTDIARLWEFTGQGLYHLIPQQLSAAKDLDVLEKARLFALFTMAMADAYIAVFDAKYAFNFWRPVTAIRNGDLDGNDATERDPAWEPFIATPMHPEYPCAHCILAATAAAVAEAFFRDGVPPFSLTSPTAPGVTRRFNRPLDFVAEAINARVYDGVHYRTSGQVGAAMGRKIGEYVVQHQLTPAR